MKLRQCPRERKIIIRPKLQLRKNPLHHHPIGESCPFLYVYPRSASVCAAAAAESLQSCPTLCDPTDSSLPGFPSLGFSRQEHWSGLPFPPPMHESEKWKWSRSVVSDSSDPMDCSPPGSSIHGIFQARVLELGAIAFSSYVCRLKQSRVRCEKKKLKIQGLSLKLHNRKQTFVLIIKHSVLYQCKKLCPNWELFPPLASKFCFLTNRRKFFNSPDCKWARLQIHWQSDLRVRFKTKLPNWPWISEVDL